MLPRRSPEEQRLEEGGRATERAAATFLTRMRSAEQCPIPGPCPKCPGTEPHYCPLADVLQWGESPERAVRFLLETMAPTGHGHAPNDRGAAVGLVLERLCRAHRREAEAVIAREPFLRRYRAGARDERSAESAAG